VTDDVSQVHKNRQEHKLRNGFGVALNWARHRCDTSSIMSGSVQQEPGERHHLPTRRKIAVQFLTLAYC